MAPNERKTRGLPMKDNRKMRIAIFHDHFGTIGGGEKLVLELAHSLDADVLTTDKNEKNLKKINVHGCRIISIGDIIDFPILKQIHSSLLFSKADFQGYDLYIMSGNWSVFAAKKHHPNIYYVHTPVRMFYDSKRFFYEIAPWYAKFPFLFWVSVHRPMVERQLRFVDHFVANSRNVQKRIDTYWHKECRIISPPIKRYRFRKHGRFYLAVSRIYPHKRIELLVDAFRKLPEEKLILVGGYLKGDHSASYAKEVLSDLPPNIKVLGEVTEKELGRLYGECLAFITLSRDEDFGMTVLEANSAGKMVIATDEGGHKETIIDGKTGYLIAPHVDDLVSKIKYVSSNYPLHSGDCRNHAKEYSTDAFAKKIRKLIRYAKRQHK